LTSEGREGQLGLPRVAEELYRTARRFRVFVAAMPKQPMDWVLELVSLPAERVLGQISR
jgi:hypothetical protein